MVSEISEFAAHIHSAEWCYLAPVSCFPVSTWTEMTSSCRLRFSNVLTVRFILTATFHMSPKSPHTTGGRTLHKWEMKGRCQLQLINHLITMKAGNEWNEKLRIWNISHIQCREQLTKGNAQRWLGLKYLLPTHKHHYIFGHGKQCSGFPTFSYYLKQRSSCGWLP